MSLTVKTQQEKDDILKTSKILHDDVAPLDECPLNCNEDPGFNFFCHLYTNPNFIVVEPIKEDGGPMATLGSTPGMGAPTIASPDKVGSGDVPSPPATDDENERKKKKKKLKTFVEFVGENG